jgi:hypothetical protein
MTVIVTDCRRKATASQNRIPQTSKAVATADAMQQICYDLAAEQKRSQFVSRIWCRVVAGCAISGGSYCGGWWWVADGTGAESFSNQPISPLYWRIESCDYVVAVIVVASVAAAVLSLSLLMLGMQEDSASLPAISQRRSG